MAKKKDSFFSGVVKEFKKVQWPTRKTTLEYALLVIAISAVTAIAIWGLDKIFHFLLSTIM
ncbi:preprotein translocase subunit SecE [uncultured Anaerococcus sp.]|uniref:preprotein translocase subunit SecE n=1 Tax=uncultured Anaerococcus sp. TaxID=293428 RepID=UPI0025D882B8|nr:preprotein translocase subunit SecE [uncultured Anaerococcus sp.]